MRLRDINLLAINEETNTKDKRIKAIHVPDSDLWSLRIQDTKLSDAGAYECQVSTDLETATQVHLKVLGTILVKEMKVIATLRIYKMEINTWNGHVNSTFLVNKVFQTCVDLKTFQHQSLLNSFII